MKHHHHARRHPNHPAARLLMAASKKRAYDTALWFLTGENPRIRYQRIDRVAAKVLPFDLK